MDNHLQNLLNNSDSFEGVGHTNTDFKPHQGFQLHLIPIGVQVDLSVCTLSIHNLEDRSIRLLGEVVITKITHINFLSYHFSFVNVVS